MSNASVFKAVGTALVVASFSSFARADVLQVGAGLAYTTPCAAVAAAQPADEIAISPGTYADSCEIGVAGLVLRGEGGQPKIDLSGTDHPAQYKGIYVVTAADVTIENLELTGAHITDDNGGNAAGVRVEAPGLTVRGCNIHDNQNGILGGTTGTLTIEHSEFFGNALGDGCNQDGCTHNVYVANIDTLNFRFNWSHGVATDTLDKGHLLKSRAKANYILYNRITGEDGFDSYEVNLPNGGLLVFVGNQVQKGAHAGNPTLLSWGEEGVSNSDKRVFLNNNTFVNDFGSGDFLHVDGATLVAHNNIFVGSGNVGSADTLSADNWLGSDPKLVDRMHFDYHLLAGSPAIGKAVDPGMADAFSLVAESEYVHPLEKRERASVHDLGAFEFSTEPNDMAPDAASPVGAADAGMNGARDAATDVPGNDAGSIANDGDAGGVDADGGNDHAAADGCSCSAPGAHSPAERDVTALACLATGLLSLRVVSRMKRSRAGRPEMVR